MSWWGGMGWWVVRGGACHDRASHTTTSSTQPSPSPCQEVGHCSGDGHHEALDGEQAEEQVQKEPEEVGGATPEYGMVRGHGVICRWLWVRLPMRARAMCG